MPKVKDIKLCICNKQQAKLKFWRLRLGATWVLLLLTLLIVAIVKGNLSAVYAAIGVVLYLAVAAIYVAKGHAVMCSLRRSALEIVSFFGSPMP